jgi:hypothetical protein
MKPVLTTTCVLVALTASHFGIAAENSGGFRGPQRNGIFPAKGLLRQWPEGGPPVIAEGRLFVRDQSKVLVYDLRATQPPRR